MKFILPSLAIALISARFICAQTIPSPLNSAPIALSPRDSTVASTTAAAMSPPATTGDRAFQPPDARGAASGGGTPEGADLLFDRATAALAQHRSIMARIRYQAEMFGNHLVGKGSYLQQGQGLERKMRLELETPIGDQNLVLEQICDGQFLWQYQPPIARNKQAARAADGDAN